MNGEILNKLDQPLDATRVHYRKAFDGGNKEVPYLEGHDVISLANQLFGYEWSFELTGTPEIVKWQVPKTTWNNQAGKKTPTLDENGIQIMQDAGNVHVCGKVIVLGNTHADVGRCAFTGIDQIDTALAGAVTDCLKRCFRQLGEQFGNTLYDKEVVEELANPKKPNNTPLPEPKNVQPSAPHVLTLDEAKEIVGSTDGKKYSDCTDEELNHKAMGLNKALEGGKYNNQQQEAAFKKLQAIKLILDSRK
jgi:hypothetical protein